MLDVTSAGQDGGGKTEMAHTPQNLEGKVETRRVRVSQPENDDGVRHEGPALATGQVINLGIKSLGSMGRVADRNLDEQLLYDSIVQQPYWVFLTSSDPSIPTYTLAWRDAFGYHRKATRSDDTNT